MECPLAGAVETSLSWRLTSAEDPKEDIGDLQNISESRGIPR